MQIKYQIPLIPMTTAYIEQLTCKVSRCLMQDLNGSFLRTWIALWESITLVYGLHCNESPTILRVKLGMLS